ncbi:MAG TPA: 50S ribosomal protein L9 [Pyrinomonadaceae bacterium]|nr:50S ribosomal protein L9 [Pyrinomonadaceae bacterium]
MAHTQVLLREDIDNLGARGEIVKVRAGYARNYLLPRKLAVQATASNVKQIEQERAALLRKEATERAGAEAQATQMNSLRLTFERRVGEHGMLYGSVTSMDIQEALRERGYEFDRRRIHLAEAIKETGEFSVRVRLHREVNVDIPVTVTPEGGAQAGATDATAATGADASAGASTEASGAETTEGGE